VLRRLLLLGLVGIVFGGGSVGLARILSAGAAERDAAVDVLRAQARGDQAAVLDELAGCRREAACRARTAQNVARLQRSGIFKLLRYDGPGGEGSVLGRTGTARVAWRAGNGPAVVQCVRLRREGDPVRGYDVSALSVSGPIGAKASCPS
jgi:hypothetical protein